LIHNVKEWFFTALHIIAYEFWNGFKMGL